MICPLNLQNVPEGIVHMRLERNSLNSLETPNMESTAVKTNVSNDRRKYDFNRTHKNYNFYWVAINFPASSFRFMLFTFCEMHSEFVPLLFFERSGIILICVTSRVDTKSIRKKKSFRNDMHPQSVNMVLGFTL